jgi:hypothetical protein
MSQHESQKSPIKARREKKLSPQKNRGEFYDEIQDKIDEANEFVQPSIIIQPVRESNCEDSEATTPYTTGRYGSSEGRAKKQRRTRGSRSKSNAAGKKKTLKKPEVQRVEIQIENQDPHEP